MRPGAPAVDLTGGQAVRYRQPRRRPFDLDGRAAPGLYAAGWALTVAGVAAAMVALLSGATGLAVAVLFLGGLGLLLLGLVAAAGAQGLQRAADGVPGYPGPSPFLVFGAVFAAANLVVFVLAFIASPLSAALAVLLSVLISGGLSVGLLRLLVVGPGALSWREMGFRLPRPGEGSALGDMAWGVLLAIPLLFLTGLIAEVLIAVLKVTPEATIPTPTDPVGLIVTLVAAGILAPLWEETFFRGFATTAWARTRSARWAIVGGGLFFAFIHVIDLSGSDASVAVRAALITFVIRIPVGLTLGWIFLRRRTLVASISLHAAYNMLPFVLLALATGAGRG